MEIYSCSLNLCRFLRKNRSAKNKVSGYLCFQFTRTWNKVDMADDWFFIIVSFLNAAAFYLSFKNSGNVPQLLLECTTLLSQNHISIIYHHITLSCHTSIIMFTNVVSHHIIISYIYNYVNQCDIHHITLSYHISIIISLRYSSYHISIIYHTITLRLLRRSC